MEIDTATNKPGHAAREDNMETRRSAADEPIKNDKSNNKCSKKDEMMFSNIKARRSV